MLRILFIFISVMVFSAGLADDGIDLDSAIDLYEQKQLEEAGKAFSTLNKSSTSATPSYYLALIFEQQGDLEEAAEYMEEAVERDETQSEYYMKLGEYYGTLAGEASVFRQLGLAKKSKDRFERAVELDDSNLEARSGLITFLLQAPGIAGGSEEDALLQAKEVARQDASRGHFELARVYQKMGDDKAAESEYRAAIDEAIPEDSDPWVAYGGYLTGEKRFDEALELYGKRLATYPDDMLVTYQLGRTASISGLNLEAGRDALMHYLSDFDPGPGDPGPDWAHYRLGLIYAQMDEPEKARAEYGAALAINSDHKQAEKALKRLD